MISERQKVLEKFRYKIPVFLKNKLNTLNEEDQNRILRQFSPDIRELERDIDFTEDPLHEEDPDIHPDENLIHKYKSKILVLTSSQCPVYCRYCTRKRRTMKNISGNRIASDEILLYLSKKPFIQEVIFSGGDPMMLSEKRLFQLIEAACSFKNIKFIRFHTRAATTMPSRFSEKFFENLQFFKNQYPDKVFAMVFHINHAAEIFEETIQILQKLQSIKILLFSQSVLLKEVNDDAAILSALFQKLMFLQIQPYYLHSLDYVEGSSHFLVQPEKAYNIMKELRNLIPPYMLPRFVKDSKQGKINLFY